MLRKLLLSLPLLILLSACDLTLNDLPAILDHYEQNKQLLLNEDQWGMFLRRNNPAAEALIPRFLTLAADHGISVVQLDLSSEKLLGRYIASHNMILLGTNYGSEAILSSLVHELAHACSLKGHETQTEAEIIAESISWLTLAGVKDLHSSDATITYLVFMAPSGTRRRVYENEDFRRVIEGCVKDLKSALPGGND